MCGLEFPDLEASFFQKYRDQGVLVVGVDPGGLMGGDDAQKLTQFAEQTGVTFPLGWDVGGTYSDFRVGDGISPFPLDVIIGPDGKVAYLQREYDATAMNAVIDALLAP